MVSVVCPHSDRLDAADGKKALKNLKVRNSRLKFLTLVATSRARSMLLAASAVYCSCLVVANQLCKQFTECLVCQILGKY